MTDWIAQMRRDADFAKGILLGQGQVTPMFIIHCEDHLKVVGAAWSNHEEKSLVQKLVALQAAADGADAIGFVAEAWLTTVKRRPGETEAHYRKRSNSASPSRSKDRVEVLISTLVYRKDDTIVPDCIVMEIARDTDGKVLNADKVLPSMEGQFAGNLFELLLPCKLGAEERAIAKATLELMKKTFGYSEHTQIIHPAGHA